MARGLWKMVIVLGITYDNGVLMVSSPRREFLERRPRGAGKMALAVPRTVPNEGIHGGPRLVVS